MDIFGTDSISRCLKSMCDICTNLNLNLKKKINKWTSQVCFARALALRTLHFHSSLLTPDSSMLISHSSLTYALRSRVIHFCVHSIYNAHFCLLRIKSSSLTLISSHPHFTLFTDHSSLLSSHCSTCLIAQSSFLPCTALSLLRTTYLQLLTLTQISPLIFTAHSSFHTLNSSPLTPCSFSAYPSSSLLILSLYCSLICLTLFTVHSSMFTFHFSLRISHSSRYIAQSSLRIAHISLLVLYCSHLIPLFTTQYSEITAHSLVFIASNS